MLAESAWELNVILISLEGNPLVLYEDPKDKDRWTHGAVTQGSVEISLAKAKALRDSLDKAIKTYEKLEESLEEYLDNEGNNL